MGTELTDLRQILEAEISVGEELRRNLGAQKQAIVDWDVAALLDQIEAREPWLRSLGELEERRSRIVNDGHFFKNGATLRQAVASSPMAAAEKSRLLDLRERSHNVFARLRTEERHLHLLMANLLAHIETAFSSVAQPAAPIYGDDGVAQRQPASALLSNKA